MARFQRGSLRIDSRKNGDTWVLRYFVTRMSDGRRVEHKIPMGLVHDFPTESAAWAEVERQHLQLNGPDFKARMTFSHLAQHFMTHELGEQTETADPKSHTTIAGYKRILKNRCIDRWGKRAALSLEPLEIEQWLKALKQQENLANPTLDKIRRVMSLVFKHGQRYGLIPRTQEANPMRFVRCKTTSGYEAMILTPKQAFDLLLVARLIPKERKGTRASKQQKLGTTSRSNIELQKAFVHSFYIEFDDIAPIPAA